MDKQELKTLLQGIRDNHYAVPKGYNQYELSLVMMDYIGDIDSELRDDLILTNLYHWIVEGVLSFEEDYKLLMIAMDKNHLLNGIGNIDNTVFSRTFSAEVVAYILYRHRQEKCIPEADFPAIFHTFLQAYTDDIDIRGYVEGKGWAHGCAHGADALDEFARCEELGYDELKKILDAIHKKVNVKHYGYIHFEDERMITAVKAVLERNLIPLEEVGEWIDNFKRIEKSGTYPDDLVIDFNVTLFLKSLYFRLIATDDYKLLTTKVSQILNEISRFRDC